MHDAVSILMFNISTLAASLVFRLGHTCILYTVSEEKIDTHIRRDGQTSSIVEKDSVFCLYFDLEPIRYG